MAFNPFTVIKSLLIKKEGVLTPDSIEIVPGSSDTSTKVTITQTNTVDINLTLPAEGGIVLTDSSTATLTNKTIDADDNTITNIENADIKVGAAIDAAKIHDGSVSNTEFGYLNGVTSDIQTQLTTNASNLNDHINDPTDAHDASAISNTPSGNLTATDVQSALNEIQTELDTASSLAGNAATKTLNNLTSPTAINQDLLPDSSSTRDLGSASAVFAEAHVESITRDTAGNLSINVTSGDLVLNPSGDIDANNKPIINVPNPVAAGDAVNKEYADSISAGLDPKEAVRVASTTDIGGSYATTPSNGRFTGAATTIDGVTLTAGDRVLLKDQSDAKQNGIYVYDGSGQYTRSPDMDGSPASEVSAGNFTFSTQGTLNSAAGFVLIGTGLITLNTDNVTFTPFSGGSGGASRFLDNLLSPVAINQNLLPGTNNTIDIGSSSLKFKDVYTQGSVIVDGTLTSSTGQNLDISTQNAALNNASDTVFITTGTTSGLGVSGQVQITTGTSASQSGNISIQTGTGAGTRGDVTLAARSTQVTAGALNIARGQTAAVVSSQESINIPSSGASEGIIQVTASDSSIRNVLAVSPTGLAQAPNLIINGDAEGKLTSSTSIFTPYADAAGTSPVDGIGGSPNVTSSVTATTPLSGSKSYLLSKDAANRQGQGWSILDVNVPLAMRGRVLSIKFDYIVNSGTFVAGTNTTDSDITIWIYDIGNLRLIQPSSYKLLSNSTTVADQFQAEFQTPIDMQSFRLIAHIGSTNAAAYELELDNIVVSPSEYVFGTPISDWQSYTPTFTGFGTVVTQNIRYRRSGSDIEIAGAFTFATTTAVEARLSLPPGLTSISGLPTLSVVGNAARNNGASTTYFGNTTIIEPSVTYLTFGTQTNGTNGLAKALGVQLGSSGDVFSFNAKIPIAGQSSSVQMADQTSTRIIAGSIRLSTGPLVNSATVIPFDTVEIDTHNSFSGGRYTVPVSGIYSVTCNIISSGSGQSFLYKNGVSAKQMQLIAATPSAGTTIISCNVGDILDIRPNVNITLSASASSNYFTVERISGPSQIAASEKILFSGYVSANQALTANTTNLPVLAVKDTHAAWNGSLFTCPLPGDYQLNLVAFATTGAASMKVYRNGALYGVLQGVSTAGWTGGAVVVENCLAGDTISVRGDGAITIVGGASTAGSKLSIIRVPGSN